MKLLEKIISIFLVTTIAIASSNTVFASEPCKTYENLKKQAIEAQKNDNGKEVTKYGKNKKKPEMDYERLIKLLSASEFQEDDFKDCKCTFENILPHIPEYVQPYVSMAHKHDLDYLFREANLAFWTGDNELGHAHLMEFNNLISKYEALYTRYCAFDSNYLHKLNNPTPEQVEELRELFLKALQVEVSKSIRSITAWDDFHKLYTKLKKKKKVRKNNIVIPSRKLPKPNNRK